MKCGLCDAPLHDDEYERHYAGCFAICLVLTRIGFAGTQEGGRMLVGRYMMDHLAKTGEQLQTSTTDMLKRDEPKGRRDVPVKPPTGHVSCLHCNGITRLYPNCSNCDGKGYV